MTKSASLSRQPRTTSVVWGWRLELQLGAATAALRYQHATLERDNLLASKLDAI